MEPDRVVEILQGGVSKGSGYLITPRHVLTARHVVNPSDVGTGCEVQPLYWAEQSTAHSLPRRPRLTAAVGWVSPDRDLAVIEITERSVPWIAPDVITFGRVPRNALPAECLGSGFPEAATGDERTIAGTVTWVLTNPPHFDFDVTSGVPKDWLQWAGFSGTALFSGEERDLLVGVVRTVDEHWGGHVLGATPVEYLFNDLAFIAFLHQAGFSSPQSRDVGPRESGRRVYQALAADLNNLALAVSAVASLGKFGNPNPVEVKTNVDLLAEAAQPVCGARKAISGLGDTDIRLDLDKICAVIQVGWRLQAIANWAGAAISARAIEDNGLITKTLAKLQSKI